MKSPNMCIVTEFVKRGALREILTDNRIRLPWDLSIIIWEVVTRKQPYAGSNFMNVTLEVLDGRRPPLPKDCPEAVAKLMTKCWHEDPAKRPSMDRVIAILDGLVNTSVDDKDSSSPSTTLPDV